MTTDDIRDKQIERYIHNRMDSQERVQFEQQMKDDVNLKNEIEELLLIKSLYDNSLFDFKKKLDETEKQLEQENFFNETPIRDLNFNEEHSSQKENVSGQSPSGSGVRKGNTMLRTWLAIAASVIIVAGYFFFNQTQTDLQQLAYNAAQNDYSQVRGTGDELDSLFESAAYQQLIDKAHEQMNEATGQEVKQKLSIYISRSYILLNKPGESIKHIESLPVELKQNCDLQYTLALAYLGKKEKAEAKNILYKIVERKCFPQEMHAKELLKKL